MKRKLFAVGLLTVLTCSGLYAQTSTLRANIPFDFEMATVAMPAGAYSITFSNRVLTVREDRGKHVAMTLTSPAGTTPASLRKAPDTGLLVFRQYGGEYFLSGVWAADSVSGHALPVTPRQKELANLARPAEPTTIAMSRK
ncbi:MAG: hypothetical protein JST11_29360 [Acidobacteria bacterium]|nr:hypothetical protein [Acidobacteriota bacterium]